MLVDPKLWEAFTAAKDALLEALQSSVPVVQHVSFDAPAVRPDSFTKLEDTINALSRAREGIRKSQEDLEAMDLVLLGSIDHVRRCMTPIGALPIELLQEVFLFATDPWDHDSTSNIAAVCRHWRATVYCTHSLFTDAEWDEWPVWLLERWCDRAGGLGLTVRLGEGAIRRIDNGMETRYHHFLETTKSSWESLFVYSPRLHKEISPASTWIFKSTLPTLKSLKVNVKERNPWNGTNKGAHLSVSTPTLRHLQCLGVVVLPREPLLHLESMDAPADFAKPLSRNALSQAPSLTRLDLTDGTPYDPTPGECVTLLKLAHLRVESQYWLFDRLCLPIMVFPNLLSLELVHDALRPELTFMKALSDKAQHLTRLRVEFVANTYPVLNLICALGHNPNILSKLQDLELSLYTKWSNTELRFDRLQYRMYDHAVVQLVKTRALSRLVLPALDRDSAKFIEERVEDFKVAAWHKVKVYNDFGPEIQ